MATPDVRGQTMHVLRNTLRDLVTEPPGYSNAEQNNRVKAWHDVKALNELRKGWIKDGYFEGNEAKSEIEHWYRLLSQIYDPQPR